MTDPILRVDRLGVRFATEAGTVTAVSDISFSVKPREVLAVIGESGSGKSVTALTVLGFTRGRGTSYSGKIWYRDIELLAASNARLRSLRGRRIAMVFQDPMTALNPVLSIGSQIVEQIRAHERIDRAGARARAVELMARVGIPAPETRFNSFPHEFSGGMRQRVMIAIAIASSPEIIIADEPTTALDVTVQAQILALLKEICSDTGAALILITHNLGVVADIADRVAVVYGGHVVEYCDVAALFEDPRHPYTWGLLGSIMRSDRVSPWPLPAIPGAPPTSGAPAKGCALQPRCPHSHAACATNPDLRDRESADGPHEDRCWLSIPEKRRRRLIGNDVIGLAPEGGSA